MPSPESRLPRVPGNNPFLPRNRVYLTRGRIFFLLITLLLGGLIQEVTSRLTQPPPPTADIRGQGRPDLLEVARRDPRLGFPPTYRTNSSVEDMTET
ncbi:UNVERIFIED_CONTAM: hypothetical protein Slati_4547100, partial [Sesamum latifolium]